MNPTEALKLLRREVGISKHVPITHLNSPSIFETEQGVCASVIRIRGVQFDCEKEHVLAANRQSWHQALTRLDQRFMIYVTTHRHYESVRLQGNFSCDFMRQLDLNYHKQFSNEEIFVNDIYLTILYRGVATLKLLRNLGIGKSISLRVTQSVRAAMREQQVTTLVQTTRQLMVSLKDFQPYLIGTNDQELGYSELIQFLSLALNGGEGLKLAPSQCARAIYKATTSAAQQRQLYPRGRLSQYLTSKQIFFGEYVQFQGATKNDCRFAALSALNAMAVRVRH